MTSFEDQILVALPHLSARLGDVLHTLVLKPGSMHSAAKVARSIGLSSRFALARRMRREGLPALHQLAAWLRVLGWVTDAEHGTESLFMIATQSDKHPAACYRTVKRLTGLTWMELRALGTSGALRLFLRRCAAIRLAGPSRGLEVVKGR
jgi:hypothetical protein